MVLQKWMTCRKGREKLPGRERTLETEKEKTSGRDREGERGRDRDRERRSLRDSEVTEAYVFPFSSPTSSMSSGVGGP